MVLSLVVVGMLLLTLVGGASPASAALGDVTTFPDATINYSHTITEGPDGNLWFTSFGNDRIGRVTPNGVVTTFGPVANMDGPMGITSGPDGALWFANNSSDRIGRITTAGAITLFSDAAIDNPTEIVAGPDGALWFTNAVDNTIGRITTGGTVTAYGVPGMELPMGITLGPDGNLWFTAANSNRIGYITTAGAITLIPANSNIDFPRDIVAGPDGALWFTSAFNDRIGRMTTGGTLTTFTGDGTVDYPSGITLGPDGNLWFALSSSARIGRITTGGAITTFPAPGLLPQSVTTGPDDAIWFTTGQANVARLDLAGSSGCLPPAFTDVSTTHPFFADICWMDQEEISTGYEPGPTFRPSAAVSRQAMSAFMYRLYGSPAFIPPAPQNATFGDVPATNTFYLEIEWMALAGITTGTPATPKPLYKPSSPVSRGAMSAFMYRLVDSPPFIPPAANNTTFGDVTATHPFYEEIEWMASEEITTGTAASPKPLYKPASNVSRGAMSAFMHRLAPLL